MLYIPSTSSPTGYSQCPFAFRFASCSCSAVAQYIQSVQSTYVSKLPTCLFRLVCTLLVALQTRIDLFSFLLSKILLMGSFNIILINHCILHGSINLGMSKYLLNLFNRHSLINSSRRH